MEEDGLDISPSDALQLVTVANLYQQKHPKVTVIPVFLSNRTFSPTMSASLLNDFPNFMASFKPVPKPLRKRGDVAKQAWFDVGVAIRQLKCKRLVVFHSDNIGKYFPLMDHWYRTDGKLESECGRESLSHILLSSPLKDI